MKQNKNLIIGIILLVIIAAGAAVALTAGSSKSGMNMTGSDGSQAADTADAVRTNKVDIKDYKFGPMVIKVKTGTTVTWTNQDTVKHNVVADESSSDAPKGPLLDKGASYSFTFKKAGTYNYHCEPHPYMHGIVQVTD